MKEIMHALTIWFVRITPILCTLAVMFAACETLYAIDAGNIIEYQKEDGTVDYIIYDTPISDSLAEYFTASYILIIFMFLTSYVFKFCSYHRVFIWFLLGNRVVSSTVSTMVVDFDVLYISYGTLIVSGLSFLLALYLHQKYGDRK